jgi:DNA-binding GntR family transcriptional regulator
MKNGESQTLKTYAEIKKRIVSGEYPALSPLRETDLSALYNVSRSTIKKALLMLEKENLVSIEVNKGARVKSCSIEEVKEFLELRAALERFIAKKTVPVIPQSDLDNMGRILKTMKQNLKKRNLLEYSSNNLLFHDTIYHACPNKAAVDMTILLKTQMHRYHSKTILVPGRDENSFEEHTAIFNAFQKRDVESATVLVEQHILNVKKVFEENFSLLFM